MTQAHLPGPGWHPDPHHPGYLRYWDGDRWTEHTSPIPMPPVPTPVRAGRTRQRWAWGAAAAVVLALVAASSSMEDTPTQTSVTDATAQQAVPSTQESEQPETDVEPSPEPSPDPTADVPDVVGGDRGAARKILDRSGLTLGPIKRVWSRKPDGTVLNQGLSAGTVAALGTAVPLVVSKLIPKVPGTAGRLRTAAVAALQSAGYRVVVRTERRTSGTDGAVLSQSPTGGHFLKPGGVVRLVVADVVPPAPAPAPASSCTPGYDPCLTPMSDYDCAGGSGDGPGYTGPVRVTGSDPYGLDNDGDGYACEG